MQKRMKTKLLKALRGGRYVQGAGRLVSPDDRFCCLGVLCNISDMGEWEYRDGDWYYHAHGGYSNDTALPLTMRQKLRKLPTGLKRIYRGDNGNKD